MSLLLSIQVPTYNRVDFLRQNLDILIPQVKKYQDEVSLFVSDNASTDGTSEVLAELQEKWDFKFGTYRHSSNIYVEDHFDFVVSQAKGRYLILMGDDEILSPNFLDCILPIIRGDKEYGMVHWNRLSGDGNCTNNILVDNQYEGCVEELDFKSFVQKVKSNPSLISSSLINRKCWDEGIKHNLDKYYGYKFLATYYIGAATINLPCVYFYFPLLIQRNPSKSWILYWPLFHIVGMTNIYKKLDTIYGDHFFMDYRNAHTSSIYSILPDIINDRKLYRKYQNEFKEVLSSGQYAFMQFWLTVPFPRYVRFIYRKCCAVYYRLFK